MKFSITGFRTK